MSAIQSGPALRQKNSTGGIKPKRVQVKVSQTVHHLTPPRKLLLLHTLLTDIHLPTHGAASIARVLDIEAIGFQPDFAYSQLYLGGESRLDGIYAQHQRHGMLW